MRMQVVHRNGYTFRLPSFDHVSWRYAAAPDGTGTGWSTGVEDLDVDQPHGLTYRSLNHLAKAVRKRIEREHSTFGDATAGGEHIPGFCKVLKHVDTTADATTAHDATLFQYNGMVHSMGQKTLWCITGATGDPTILLLHPDKQYKGGDVTWQGAHEFDQSVDFTGPVHIDGPFLCDGTADFTNACIDGTLDVYDRADFSSVGISGDSTISGALELDGAVKIDGTLNIAGATQISGDVTISGFMTLTGGASIFNDPTAKLNNTAYEALTSGIVCAITVNGGTQIYGYTDSANPPTTILAMNYGNGAAPPVSITMPVKKGDYWKVAGAATVYWTPIGT